MTIDTEALRKLLSEASPGPWHVEEKTANCHCYDDQILSSGYLGVAFSDEADSRLIALAPQLAADNIALQAEVEEAKGIGDRAAGYLDVASDEIKRLQAENAKLREALEDVLNVSPKWGDSLMNSVDRMMHIARDALTETPN